MSGWKAWQADEVVEATDFQNFLQDQVVQVYAGTASQGSVIGTATTEGMVTYLTDNNQLAVALGTATWQGVNYRTVTASTAATYTASIADANTLIVTSGTPTVTVPDVLQVGQGFEIVRDGGTVTLAAGTGVTTWAGAGTAGTAVTFKIDQQYNGAQILKVAANSYRVIGRVIV